MYLVRMIHDYHVKGILKECLADIEVFQINGPMPVEEFLNNLIDRTALKVSAILSLKRQQLAKLKLKKQVFRHFAEKSDKDPMMLTQETAFRSPNTQEKLPTSDRF